MSELTIYEDEQKLLDAGKSKRLKKVFLQDLQLLASKILSLENDKILKNEATDFSKYVDPEGEKSTGAKGFMIQLNKRIKSAIGKSVQEIQQTEDMLLVAAVRLKLAKMIKSQKEQNKLRREVKDNAYDFIDKFGKLKTELNI
jgi:hypothetical protein